MKIQGYFQNSTRRALRKPLSKKPLPQRSQRARREPIHIYVGAMIAGLRVFMMKQIKNYTAILPGKPEKDCFG
jgi:hypothetical protein